MAEVLAQPTVYIRGGQFNTVCFFGENSLLPEFGQTNSFFEKVFLI